MPFFIVRNVSTALAFYRDRLGFVIEYQGPADDDIFFGIVGRGGASIMLKSVGVNPLPNSNDTGMHVGTPTSMSLIPTH